MRDAVRVPVGLRAPLLAHDSLEAGTLRRVGPLSRVTDDAGPHQEKRDNDTQDGKRAAPPGMSKFMASDAQGCPDHGVRRVETVKATDAVRG
jgi:hypothetical protein